MGTARYRIFENDDSQLQYELISKNDKIILTSVKYNSIEDIYDSITKTIEIGRDMVNFDILLNSDFKYYFNVIENTDSVIATSNLYENEQDLILGCNSVMDNCETLSINHIIGNKNGIYDSSKG